MNQNELQRRAKNLTSAVPQNALNLIQLLINLSSKGKLNFSSIENELTTLLNDAEKSAALQKQIDDEQFMQNVSRLINSVADKKISPPDNIYTNTKLKDMVDRKINSLVDTINKIIRKDGPLEEDFICKNFSGGMKIIAYAGIDSTVMKIPDTINGLEVKEIGDYVFHSNTMTSLELPKTLTKLGAYAFQHCQNLKQIIFPPQVMVVCKGCFENCTSLEKIILNENLQSIEATAFKNVAVERIIIPARVIFIGNEAFQTSSPLQVLFEGKNSALSLAANSFSSQSTLYYRHSEIENNFKDVVAKVSGNFHEFEGNNFGVWTYRFFQLLKGAAKFFFGLIIGICMLFRSVFSTPVGAFVGGGAAIYAAYKYFFVERDEIIRKVGSGTRQLNDQRGVDQTVIAYNTIMQSYCDEFRDSNPDLSKRLATLRIKDCTIGEVENNFTYYYATFENDDYICLKANSKGYLAAAYVWINQNHSDTITEVLFVAVQTLVNAHIEDDVYKEIFEKIGNGASEVNFHSLQAHRDFQITMVKKKGKYRYTIQAFH